MEELNRTIQDILEPKRIRYFGISVERMSKGDYSIGACISYDNWLGECYLYINLLKWTICIGLLSKVVEE